MTEPRADELLEVRNSEEVRALLGPLDSNTRLIRELHGVNVLLRDGGMRLMGAAEDVERVRDILAVALESLRSGREVTSASISRSLRRSSVLPGSRRGRPTISLRRASVEPG